MKCNGIDSMKPSQELMKSIQKSGKQRFTSSTKTAAQEIPFNLISLFQSNFISFSLAVFVGFHFALINERIF